MRALKRTIYLFLAGITALTMMCAGTISAGAVLSSKMYVDGQIDENGKAREYFGQKDFLY